MISYMFPLAVMPATGTYSMTRIELEMFRPPVLWNRYFFDKYILDKTGR